MTGKSAKKIYFLIFICDLAAFELFKLQIPKRQGGKKIVGGEEGEKR